MPRRVTKANPAGVRPYDHTTTAARLPGHYQTVAKALDDLVHAMNSADIDLGGQDGWLRAVTDLAAALPFSDGCTRCRDHNDLETYNPCIPARVEIEQGWLRGYYQCPQGHRWTCNWSVSAA